MGAWRVRLESYMGWIVGAVAVAGLVAIGVVVLTIVGPTEDEYRPPATTAVPRTLDQVIADPSTPPACRDALRGLGGSAAAPTSTAPATTQPSSGSKGDNPFAPSAQAAQRMAELGRACDPSGTGG